MIKKNLIPITNFFNHQIPIGDLGPLFVKNNSYFLKNKKSYISSNIQKNFLKVNLNKKYKFKCGISWVSVNRRIGISKKFNS